MANTWITSDLHFFHKNIHKFCPETRPWGSVEEMNEALVDAWNTSVQPNDTIYFLGDFSFGKADDTELLLTRLQGRKYLVRGNHDRALSGSLEKRYFVHAADILEHKICGRDIIMCHYPIAEWHKAQYGSIHFYGHTHGSFQNVGRSMDVGWDVHNRILNIEEAIDMVKDKEVITHHGKTKV